jgi:hypothetical protein
MRFRWIAAIALWTMISGPIFAPCYPARSHSRPPAHRTAQPTSARVPGR